ncbi:hypothetical protein JL100_035780 (plasmid) [Skermanella mucosa]|uniref:hypothetical protein n=1 Tax=Skermanella mucosa TaxID=1789672 RepID=UPI00192AC984|nr:hypothetical protein [Skermanella mucosa]UEM25145.1 hypothetical protein JL100_035780 [Skermanella mucosa]
MNQYERVRLAMAERSVREGEEQIARLSETIRGLERKGNEMAAARARKLLKDFQCDLALAYADLNVFRADSQPPELRGG